MSKQIVTIVEKYDRKTLYTILLKCHHHYIHKKNMK